MLPLALQSGEVLLIVAIVATPLAAIAFAGAGSVYKQIGKGDFALDLESDLGPAKPSAAGPKPSKAEQEAETRQLLEAKAFRQQERGEEPLDVEAELRRLMAAPQVDVKADPALLEEVRQLVVARNQRRLNRGEEPLDVEAEVARQLRELETLGQ